MQSSTAGGIGYRSEFALAVCAFIIGKRNILARIGIADCCQPVQIIVTVRDCYAVGIGLGADIGGCIIGKVSMFPASELDCDEVILVMCRRVGVLLFYNNVLKYYCAVTDC